MRQYLELAKELGINRRLVYIWLEQLEPTTNGEGPPANSLVAMLRIEVSQLKRVQAEKILEVDFFKEALRRASATLTERQSWRTGIYAQIRAVMPRQGGLRIERTCQLDQVSQAGFYRSLQRSRPWRKRSWCAIAHLLLHKL